MFGNILVRILRVILYVNGDIYGDIEQTISAALEIVNIRRFAQCGIPDVTSHRIVGGTVATAHAYPWQVSLGYGSHHMCGGTIIDSQWILTAAHCFEDTTHSYWTVATSIHDRGHIYRSQVHNVRNVIVHTGYSSRSNHNDIALIKLDKPLDLTDSTTKAACFPNKHEDFDGLVCTVTGWGALHTDGPGTRLLNEVDVPIMDSNRCKYYLGNVIYGSNICAGYNQGGRDSCQGDSGGPLVCKKDSVYKITGVVSWGYGCAKRHAPGVYTRVSSFIDWINTNKARHP